MISPCVWKYSLGEDFMYSIVSVRVENLPSLMV